MTCLFINFTFIAIFYNSLYKLKVEDILDQYPLFLKTESRHFISLFGGCNESAAIDTEGLITVINWSHQPSISDLYESYRPQLGEKAIMIGFANGFTFALDSNGSIFEANSLFQKLTNRKE